MLCEKKRIFGKENIYKHPIAQNRTDPKTDQQNNPLKTWKRTQMGH